MVYEKLRNEWDSPVEYEKIFEIVWIVDEEDTLLMLETMRSSILRWNSMITITKLAHLYDDHCVCVDFQPNISGQ